MKAVTIHVPTLTDITTPFKRACQRVYRTIADTIRYGLIGQELIELRYTISTQEDYQRHLLDTLATVRRRNEDLLTEINLLQLKIEHLQDKLNETLTRSAA